MKTTLTSPKRYFFTVPSSFFFKFVFILFSFSSIAVNANNSSSIEDNCVYGICESAGEIGKEQTIVRGTQPEKLIETKVPRCEPGQLEYLWMYYSSSSGGWKHIPNSNSKDYQPGELFKTTYFLRCVRKKGCPTYKESNILRIEIVDCMPSGIEHEEACLGDPVKFYAKTVYSANDVKYRWTFEGGSPSSSNSQYVSVTWNSEGLKKVTLTVVDGQCENTYEEDVYVINCDCKGFYCKATSSSNCGVGNARANGYGGAEPYSYRWSNGSTARRIVGVAPGTYGVTVTDANGCKCSRYVTIAPPSEIRCRAYVKKHPSKCGAKNGIAVAQGIGGSGHYFYKWSNGQVGPIAIGLGGGTYNVTITDTKTGCKTVCTVTLEEPCCRDFFSIDLEEVPAECPTDLSSVKITLSNGIPGCIYGFGGTIFPPGGGLGISFVGQFVGPSGMATFENIPFGGTVCIGVASCDRNCELMEKCIDFSEDPGIPDCDDNDCNTVDFFDEDECECKNNPISILCIPCFVYDPTTCKCNPAPAILLGEIGIVVTQPDCDIGGTTGSVTINATGGTPPYTYSLNGSSQESPTFNNLDPGNYSVVVSDASACSEIEASGQFSIDACCDIVRSSCSTCEIFDEYLCDCVFDPNCITRKADESGEEVLNNAKLETKATDPKRERNEMQLSLNGNLAIVNSTTSFFPNPFHDNVNIVLSDYSAHAKSLTIEVISVTGQVIQRQVVDAAAATHELKLGNQAEGIYIVRITGEGIQPEIHKIVKN